MKKSVKAAALSAVLVLGAGAGCSRQALPVATAAPAGAPTVTAKSLGTAPAVAVDSQRSHYLLASGPVTEEQQLDVVALRAGVISGLNADVDTSVTRDQLLAKLDDRQLRADRAAAEYKFQSLESDLKNWQAEQRVREADLQRAEEMRKAGINTQEQLEHTRYDLEAVQFEVLRQREEMQAAQAAVQSLDLEVSKMSITAPFRGVVSQRFIRLGQYVNVGEKLFHVMGNSPLEVRFTLPGAEMAHIRRGEEVQVSANPSLEPDTSGTITHISPVVDPGSGMVEVVAQIKGAAPGVMPGAIASVRINRSR